MDNLFLLPDLFNDLGSDEEGDAIVAGQPDLLEKNAMNMMAVQSSRMLVDFYQTIWNYIQNDSTLHSLCLPPATC
jgi:hypothetical protein